VVAVLVRDRGVQVPLAQTQLCEHAADPGFRVLPPARLVRVAHPEVVVERASGPAQAQEIVLPAEAAARDLRGQLESLLPSPCRDRDRRSAYCGRTAPMPPGSLPRAPHRPAG